MVDAASAQVPRGVTRVMSASVHACILETVLRVQEYMQLGSLFCSRCKVDYTMTCTSLFGIDVRIAGKLPYPNGSNIQSRWYTDMQLVLQLYLHRDAGVIDVYEDHVRSGLRGRSGPISGHLCKWYLWVWMKAWRHFELSMISSYQVQYVLAELNHYSS